MTTTQRPAAATAPGPPRRARREAVPAGRALVVLAWASLVANVAIVVTGGAVRLTGSGLGCPTWPRCTDASYVPHGSLGIHGAIEFGNRMLTFALAAIAVATLVVAWRTGRRHLRRLAVVLLVGIPAQAVLGGLTVLTDLNPWLVAFHLLISMAMVAVAVALVRASLTATRSPGAPLGSPGRPSALALAAFAAGWLVLYLGTVVTGAGPHAGDVDAPRNGLGTAQVSQVHADAVFLLVGLSLALVLVVRPTGAGPDAVRAVRTLLGVVLAQGVVGFVQYFTDLPVALVATHMLGAALVSAALAWVLLAVRTAPARSVGTPPQRSSGSSATATKSSER